MGEDSGPPLLSLWGKARPVQDAAHGWHPLVYHSLDVAAVGEALLRERVAALAQTATLLGWSEISLSRLILFLLALHDIGKISRPFQGKVPELWPEDPLGPLGSVPRDPGHPVTGAWLLQRTLFAELTPLFPSWPPNLVE